MTNYLLHITTKHLNVTARHQYRDGVGSGVGAHAQGDALNVGLAAGGGVGVAGGELGLGLGVIDHWMCCLNGVHSGLMLIVRYEHILENRKAIPPSTHSEVHTPYLWLMKRVKFPTKVESRIHSSSSSSSSKPTRVRDLCFCFCLV